MKYLGTKQLETERLILRRFKLTDANDMFNNWCSDKEVAKYVTWKAHQNASETEKLLENWIERYDNDKTFKWVAEIKDTNEIIGSIDVVSDNFLEFGACEIGYCYGRKFWHKGYASECLNAVMKYLFEECDAYVIFAKHLSENPNSSNVMKKCGLKYEGTGRGRYVDPDNIRNDMLTYSITKDEFESLNNK